MNDLQNSMIFVDKCLDDSLINVIEKMVNLHIDKNYKEVRNIILGYDSKNDKWISKYGEALDKQLSGEKIYTSSVCSFFLNTENFEKQGMLFYEDDIYNNVRFHMDESVKRILSVLFTLSDRVIDYRYIIDVIISEWNMKNIRSSINPTKINVDPDICGSLYFHQIEVRDIAWAEFKSIAKHKGINIRDSFKKAVVGFLEERSKMLKHY